MATSSLTLDTDIGTDVDDVLALATVLGSPELDLTGVTTVYGDVLLRARMVARVAAVAGREVGPIVPGRAGTRSGRPVWWPGHEGTLLAELDQEKVDTSIDPVELLTKATTVLAIGPLTNIAEAVEHSACTIQQLFVMGGRFDQPVVEHNIECDIDAADAVFASGVPTTVIGLEQTQRLRLGGAIVAEIEAAGPLGRLLAAEMRQFWRFSDADFNVPHDPAAVLMLTQPALFRFAIGWIEIDASGVARFTPDKDGPHRIVTDLDTGQVTRRIVDRILAACEGAQS